ncbi:MAG: hypothetical protein WA211_04315 [Candidatus Acidiferrales bacterium]|jgi:uncharacterized membrane protein HdeD (DUF308 family)
MESNLNSVERPFQVTLLGWLFIAVGIFATAYHLSKSALDRWMLLIVLFEFVAIVAGFFLLRGARWARWLLLAWIAFHVVVSGLNSVWSSLPHAVLLLAVGYVLLGPPTAQYYRRAQEA